MSKDMEIVGIVLLFCVIYFMIFFLSGCADHPKDDILRYYLTHPECQTASNIFGNC